MKILRLIYEWPPPWDGLSPQPYEVTTAQTKLGHEVFVFAGRWPRQGDLVEPKNVKIIKFFGSESMPFRSALPGAMLITAAPLLFLRYLVWRFKKKNQIDMIHSHGHFAFYIYLYRFLLLKFFKGAKELKTPLVVNFHNTVEGRWRTLMKNGEKISKISQYLDYPLARWSDKLAVKIADALIFVSNGNKEQAIKYYNADPKKCFVVENGVNTDSFVAIDLEEKEKTRLELGVEPGDKLIFNNGAMVERKNIHLIVEALEFLPPHYKLLLIGPFLNKEYENMINDIIFEKKLTNRVLINGYTPYPQIHIAFQAADIFVLPSKFEGLPKVVMQALACEVPTLTSGFKLSQELKGLYYVENMNAKDIAGQIKKIIEEDALVDVPKIRELYSWDTRAKLIENIYAQVFKDRKSV